MNPYTLTLFRLRVFLSIWILGFQIGNSQIPNNFTFTPVFETNNTNTFDKPVSMDEIPGKPGFFLVSESNSGNLWLLSPIGTTYSKTLFAHFEVNKKDADLGLAGILFHPDFIHNRKYYVKQGDPNSAVRTLRLDEHIAAPDFLKDSETPARTLLRVKQPDEFVDHNGGGMVFGLDGFLYLGIGDGGWDQMTLDKYGNGQSLETLLGKIVRINVDKNDPGLEYSIPQDNPFYNNTNTKMRKEIFAYGVRNPFRMTRDKLTGEIYLSDIGLDKFEKIYNLRKGANYGWKLQEYTFCFTPGTCDNITVDKPIAYLGYGPVKCFIGGHVYRGDPTSPFYGVYLFGDFTTKRILGFKKDIAGPVAVTDLASAPMEMTGFTVDSQNNFYLVGYFGTIYQLINPDLKPGPFTGLITRRRHLISPSPHSVFCGLNGKRLSSPALGSLSVKFEK